MKEINKEKVKESIENWVLMHAPYGYEKLVVKANMSKSSIDKIREGNIPATGKLLKLLDALDLKLEDVQVIDQVS
jgi:hypothetical protein